MPLATSWICWPATVTLSEENSKCFPSLVSVAKPLAPIVAILPSIPLEIVNDVPSKEELPFLVFISKLWDVKAEPSFCLSL